MGGYFSSQKESQFKSDAQRAMEDGTFCVICGGPFDLEGEIYDIDPKDPHFQWLHRLRLLGSVKDVASHVLASDGFLPSNTSDLDCVFLSEPAFFSLTGSGYFHVSEHTDEDDFIVDTLHYEPAHGTLFPLHDACIEISCRVIDRHQSTHKNSDRKPALSILTRLLNGCFTERNERSEFHGTVNDIFDLSFCSPAYGPRSVLALGRLEWWGGAYNRFYTNPIEKVDTATFVKSVLQSSPRSRDEPDFTLVPSSKPQKLECLPRELLDTICSHLPIPSVIALHRTSKALALQIPLDSAFWRNSLGDGSLHPHIWDLDTRCIEQHLPQPNIAPLDPTASWDWKSTAKLLAMKRFPISGCDDRLVDVPNGFWNRCRIWSTIEEALQQQELG
ncbi:hypothetical protein TW65_04347 [Stemphylium lycopersici]|nr:hypothetical protein TW65_04347 [Stemphylium lycopersici]